MDAPIFSDIGRCKWEIHVQMETKECVQAISIQTTSERYHVCRCEDNPASSSIVKICPYCNASFTIEDIFHSESVLPLGMSIPESGKDTAYFYFQHDIPSCGTSFVVPVEAFRDWISELIPEFLKFDTNACEGHCRNLTDMRLCSQDCRNAPFRRLMAMMIKCRLKKSPTSSKISESDTV